MNQTTCTKALEGRTTSTLVPWLKLRRTQWSLLILSAATLLLTVLHFNSGLGIAFGLTPLVILAIILAAFSCEFMDSSLGMGYGTTLTPLLMLTGFEPIEIVPAVLFSEFLTGNPR